jgi:hypothetical protein
LFTFDPHKHKEIMKGTIFQLIDVDGDPYGIWWTEDETVTSGMLADWYQSYDDSDLCAKEGPDAFEIFVAEIGYKIERVYVESQHVY